MIDQQQHDIGCRNRVLHRHQGEFRMLTQVRLADQQLAYRLVTQTADDCERR